jgi:hypothetical protein
MFFLPRLLPMAKLNELQPNLLQIAHCPLALRSANFRHRSASVSIRRSLPKRFKLQPRSLQIRYHAGRICRRCKPKPRCF